MANTKQTKADLAAAQAEIATLKAALAQAQTTAGPAEVAVPEATMAEIRATAHSRIRALGSRPCACGCGTSTKSTFAPGHDAKHYASLVKAAVAEWRAAQATPAAPAEAEQAS